MNYKYFNNVIPSVSTEDNIKQDSIVYILSDGTSKKYLAYELELFFENYNHVAVNPYSPINSNYASDTINNFVSLSPIVDVLSSEAGLGFNVSRILIKTKENIWFDYSEAKSYIDINKNNATAFPNSNLDPNIKSLSQFINDTYNASTSYPIDIALSYPMTSENRISIYSPEISNTSPIPQSCLFG
jgi:hypothetical protein